MINNYKKWILLIINILIFSYISCSNISEGTSRVTINLNIQNHENAWRNPPLIDRFLRIFATDAKAQTAPAGITSLTLNVKASDMDSISKSFPVDSLSISIDVPAGKGRTFELTAVTPTFTYIGTSLPTDLTANKDELLSIIMVGQYANVAITPTYTLGTPASIGSYTVNVTSAGTSKYSSTTYTAGATIQVPSGTNLDIELLVSTPSATLRGTLTGQTLTAGDTMPMSMPMSLYETKIVVPDYLNNRIVQIDNFTTPNWNPKINTNLGVSLLVPYDIDFDSIGRIYIANNYFSTGGGVLRLDNINDATTGDNTLINIFSVLTIAVDRTNNILYYATSSALYKNNLTGSAEVPLNIGAPMNISLISNIDADGSGFLYITCYYGATASYAVVKYNISTPSVVANYTISPGVPWDVTYKSPYVYVANFNNGGANNSIIRLNAADLTSPTTLLNNPLNVTDVFYGPHRFVAILPGRFTIVDDGRNPTGVPSFNRGRLVSFDDITGTNWSTYGSNGIGQDQFTFFESYSC